MVRWIRQLSSHLILLRIMPPCWRQRPVRRVLLVVVDPSWTTSPWLPPFIAIVSTFLDCGDGRSLCYHCCDAESWPVVPKSSWPTTIQTHHDGIAVNAILVVRYHFRLWCSCCRPSEQRESHEMDSNEKRDRGRKVLMVIVSPLLGRLLALSK